MKYCLSGLRTECNQRAFLVRISRVRSGSKCKIVTVDRTNISGGINNDIKKWFRSFRQT